MPNKENRSPRKLAAVCQVTFQSEERAGRGTSGHFHERGMLIRCEEPLSLRQRLKLNLKFPGLEAPLEVEGIVVWTNKYGPDDDLAPRGMGVRFLSLDRNVEKMLAKLAKHYETAGNMYECYYS